MKEERIGHITTFLGGRFFGPSYFNPTILIARTLSCTVRIWSVLIRVPLELRLNRVEDLGLLLDVTQRAHPGRVTVDFVVGSRLRLARLLFVDVTQ